MRIFLSRCYLTLLLLLHLLLLTPVSAFTWERVLRATDASSFMLYDATGSIKWGGTFNTDNGQVTLEPAYTSVALTSFYYPGLEANWTTLPAAYAADAAAATIQTGYNADRLILFSTNAWFTMPFAARPDIRYLLPTFTCALSPPSLSFGDRPLSCTALDSSFTLTVASSVSAASGGSIYPLALTLTFTSASLTTPSTQTEQDAMLLLFRVMRAYTDQDMALGGSNHRNVNRRNKARVAVGFLWCFAACVLFFSCLIAATFQSWLYPIFPLRYSLYIWSVLLLALAIGISVGTGFAGFLILLLIYVAYACAIGIVYYIYQQKNRETPTVSALEAEQKALLARKRVEREKLRAAAASSGGAMMVRQKPSSGATIGMTSPADSVPSGAPVIHPNAASSSTPQASVSPAPVNSNSTNSANEPHLQQHHHHPNASPDIDALYEKGLEKESDGDSWSPHPYATKPHRMGHVQSRCLGFTSMLFLTCFVLCVALFGIWRVNDYYIIERVDTAPLQQSIVEYIPQTISKGVEAVYAFDGLATKLHLDNMFFHIGSDWCGDHYSSYLEPGNERYEAIQVDYVIKYSINMELYSPSSYEDYDSVNSWFIRDIKPEYRPLPTSLSAIASPAEARVTVWNNNPEGVKFWIKGDAFTMEEFLTAAGNPAAFIGGTLVLLRLAPQDYHVSRSCAIIFRLVTSCCALMLTLIAIMCLYFPAARTIMMFDSTLVGQYAYVAIGALCVGSVTVSDPNDPSRPAPAGTVYARGQKLGNFAFGQIGAHASHQHAAGGSTIALVFQKGAVRFDDDLTIASQNKVETLLKVNSQIGLSTYNGLNPSLAPT